MGDSVTTNEPESSETSDSDSETTDGSEESGGSTSAAEGFPYEGTYTGSFNAPCEIDVAGTLAVEVDAAGVISGTATALDQAANVSGNIDAMGSVMGTAMIVGVGACQLTGNVNLGLVGSGSFSCQANCTGTWNLASI